MFLLILAKMLSNSSCLPFNARNCKFSEPYQAHTRQTCFLKCWENCITWVARCLRLGSCIKLGDGDLHTGGLLGRAHGRAPVPEGEKQDGQREWLELWCSCNKGLSTSCRELWLRMAFWAPQGEKCLSSPM